jgi:predicted dehydrogenase/threonine dehydrogenase-like Zn-dependent dehydrogenase
MKHIAQNYRTGELAVLDVPPPACAPGGVLVRSLYSLISTGTELMKVTESKLSLIGKARARPEQVKKVLEAVAQQGLASTYRKAMNRLDSYTPLGYSLAGVVTEVGRGVAEFSVGQLVSCAGNEFALHAEVNWVPVNMCVPVPDGVTPQIAAFATVGAIALQGVRQADAQLGDTACVIGLGLVGQLVVQLLVASGVRVVGLDIVPDRCRRAEKAGALLCAAPDPDGLRAVETALLRASGGVRGADRVLLAAGGDTNAPAEIAARVARDRATIVDIGKCKLDLPWNAYYEKELEVRFSRSYGPGRYDQRYEVEGVDYPAGYVRWTERRNLACFLDLVAKGEIDPQPLVSGVFPLEDAADVYGRLQSGSLEGVAFLFEYPEGASAGGATGPSLLGTEPGPARRPPDPVPVRRRTRRSVRVAFIGAGNYASSMLLPHLARRPDVKLARVVTRRSLSAVNAKKKFGFFEADTDLDGALADASIDAVFIVTRHSSHANLVCRALEAGKSVFVEKPLALDSQQLEQVLTTVDTTGNDRLMVGFNRRFSSLLGDMRARFGGGHGPIVARYLVSGGPLPSDSWYRNEDVEGSRFVGEGGHFIDTLSWWVGTDPVEVSATAARDGEDLMVNLRYGDGSVASIAYVTAGHPRFPKETLDVSGGGRSARLDNFKTATVWAGRRRWATRIHRGPDKGQSGEIAAFLEAVRSGAPMPISLTSLASTTRATLAADVALAAGRPQRV